MSLNANVSPFQATQAAWLETGKRLLAEHRLLFFPRELVISGLTSFRMFFPEGKFFDLSQNPGQRARLGTIILPTLTKTCGSFWSEDQGRFMRHPVKIYVVAPTFG